MSEVSLEKLHHISTLLIETGNSGYAEQVDKAILAITSMQTTITDLKYVLQAAVDCGMVPVTSAKEGGAARHSEQVKVADLIRSALNKDVTD